MKNTVLRILTRIENLVVFGGLLAVAIGVLMIQQGNRGVLPASCLVLGIGLLTSLASRRIGWVLTGISLILFVIALFA